jgi:hypothetical protein
MNNNVSNDCNNCNDDKLIKIMTRLEERLANIEILIGIIVRNNKIVEEDCSKMRQHIDFIENTYALVRTPLSYIKEKIEYVMGRETTTELPLLKI